MIIEIILHVKYKLSIGHGLSPYLDPYLIHRSQKHKALSRFLGSIGNL